jgi:homoserine kinase type II
MAVYTHVPEDRLSAFIAEYDIGDVVSCKGIAEGVENTNYLLQTDQAQFILTLYEKRVNANDLPFFLGLIEHLADRGIQCPVPIHGRDGSALRELEGKPAALVSFLNGLCVNRPNRQNCVELGDNLARMHLASADFTLSRPNALGHKDWRSLFEQVADQCDAVSPGLEQMLEDELDFLDSHWPTGLREGIIHADLFPDNVFFNKGALSGFIDFYFACHDALAYDLSISINAWCFERGGEFNATNARALCQAYQQVEQLPEADIAALPILCRGSAMRFLLTRLYDWVNTVDGALVRPKDPMDYVSRLKFHQRATSAESYGIS